MTTQDPYAATPAKMLPFARALAADVEAGLTGGLGAPVTPAALRAAAARAHQYYEQTWRYVQSLNVVPHACAAGCSHCCHLTVEVSAPEVSLIAAHLRAAVPAERLAQIAGRVRATALRVGGLSPEERVRAAVPCALLQEGQCSVYAVRPLGCRSWNSRDAGACAKVMADGGGDLRLVQDQRPFGIESGVRAGFTAALTSAGEVGQAEERLELNAALSAALESTDGATD